MNSTLSIETWFIPFDIFMIVCDILTVIFSTIILLIIILDKTCHTIPMMLVSNTCLTTLVSGCSLMSLGLFTFQNDFKQIQYQDLLCVFRAYMAYISCAAANFSFLLQAIYRYIIVVYPNRLFWRSVRFQIFLICLTWVLALIYPIPFLLINEIIYNVDNQICQIPLRFSFSIIYVETYAFLIPVLLVMLIYLKLIRYVHGMRKHITPVKVLFRAQKELKMVQRTVILLTILMTVGFPYALFTIMSFFTHPPKYHFRIAYIFVNASLVSATIALFQFNEPLKMSIMKKVARRSNVVVPHTI